jgi:chloramphenicol-sensitive protein RarD
MENARSPVHKPLMSTTSDERPAVQPLAAPDAPTPRVGEGDTMRGLMFAVVVYVIWGVLPFYMKAVAHIPAIEVLAHRILWSVPIAFVLLVWMGRTGDIAKALRSPRTLLQAACAGSFVAINWGVYVWAIGAGRTLETALGYYINPLLTVLIGALLLGERLLRVQVAALGFAAIGVAVLTWENGGLPWVSLAIAGSWGMYAVFKRTLPIGPAQGFFIEVLLMLPVALAYIVWRQATGVGHFMTTDTTDVLLLVGIGFVTAVPLIIYAVGAKGLTLSTIGILQYIAPTLVFLIAVFAFGEHFTMYKAVAFAFIWLGLVVYTYPMVRERWGRRDV